MTTTDSFLRLPEVLAIIPVSRATWYDGIKKGRFPAPVKLGPRVSLWRRSDIELLIASLSTNTAATLN
ncbi:helix-turn-helix transcriptional regulator [Vogesella urethralis]|uniref:helix-turn-helix transcriptional regulator n=1 Tax=Vogesella urethralis TaxID=2592656 RepID=UPI001184C30D|nr:AlpA family phage regulatory protein [Vogesella urethralis]